MTDIVSPKYSETSEPPRPCLTCGADTAPGRPGHHNSTVDYIDHLCEEHDAVGVRGENCLDCETEALYFCGDHSDVTVIEVDPGQSNA